MNENQKVPTKGSSVVEVISADYIKTDSLVNPVQAVLTLRENRDMETESGGFTFSVFETHKYTATFTYQNTLHEWEIIKMSILLEKWHPIPADQYCNEVVGQEKEVPVFLWVSAVGDAQRQTKSEK